MYGLFDLQEKASEAAERVRGMDYPAHLTTTLTRAQYWETMVISR
jgi:hypothetical protein